MNEYKTELETELEKAFAERGYTFLEQKKEQIEKFAQADLEKYPEYKEMLDSEPDFNTLIAKTIEAANLPSEGTRFEIGNRLLNQAFQANRGTYKIKSAIINNLTINYRIIIDPIDDPEEAYTNGVVHETIDIEYNKKKALIFQYDQDLEMYSFYIRPGIEEIVNLQTLDSFLEYRDRINEYRKIIQGMKALEEMPEPPELKPKEFAEQLAGLVSS